MAMAYQTAYVAQVSMGANKQQLLNALMEANEFDGPSLVIAYSPCIAHGVPLQRCMTEEEKAVTSGFWHLFRFNPARIAEGKNPLTIDSPTPKTDIEEFLRGENRFRTMDEEKILRAKKESEQKLAFLKHLYDFYQKQ